MRIFSAILGGLFTFLITGCASFPCPDIGGTYKNENPVHSYHLARLFFDFQYDPSVQSYSRDIVEIVISGNNMLVNTGNKSVSLLRGRDFECGDGSINLTNQFPQGFNAGLVT